jgi:branched-chain amino acid transport system substrate-binding protein
MFAALTYESTSLVLEGIKKNGPTSEGIKKFLDEVKDFDGITGKLSFNEDQRRAAGRHRRRLSL